MEKSAIVGSAKPQRAGSIATIAGVLLGACAVAAPAHSGDFYNPYDSRPYSEPYPYDAYRYEPAPYYHGAAYRSNCYSCGYRRYGPVVQRRGRVVERRWVEREYIERGYASPRPVYYRNYGYADSPPYGYPDSPWRYYHSPTVYPDYQSPSVYPEARPNPFPYGYGGVRWQSASDSYGYAEPPRPPAPVVSIPSAYYYNDYKDYNGYNGYNGYNN